jgi:hypothetical protein
MTEYGVYKLFSPDSIRVIKSMRMRWVEHGASMMDMINVYKSAVGKLEEKRPHEILKRKWKDNIVAWSDYHLAGLCFTDLLQMEVHKRHLSSTTVNVKLYVISETNSVQINISYY